MICTMDVIKKPKKTPRVTASVVVEWDAIRARRLELDRQSASLHRKEARLYKQMLASVQDNCGKTRSIRVGSFLLQLVERAGRVAWKQAFVDRCGEDAAEELIAQCPTTEKLDVKQTASRKAA